MQHSTIPTQAFRIHVASTKIHNINIIINNNIYLYEIETKQQLEHRLKKQVKQQIKNRINERMEKYIKTFQKKTKTRTNTSKINDQAEFNKLMDHVFSKNTKFKNYPQYFPFD